MELRHAPVELMPYETSGPTAVARESTGAASLQVARARAPRDGRAGEAAFTATTPCLPAVMFQSAFAAGDGSAAIRVTGASSKPAAHHAFGRGRAAPQPLSAATGNPREVAPRRVRKATSANASQAARQPPRGPLTGAVAPRRGVLGAVAVAEAVPPRPPLAEQDTPRVGEGVSSSGEGPSHAFERLKGATLGSIASRLPHALTSSDVFAATYSGPHRRRAPTSATPPTSPGLLRTTWNASQLRSGGRSPPLSHFITAYLERETELASTAARVVPSRTTSRLGDPEDDGSRPVASGATLAEDPWSALQRLRPYREALLTLADAFPAYTVILQQIQQAYDAAIAHCLASGSASLALVNGEVGCAAIPTQSSSLSSGMVAPQTTTSLLLPPGSLAQLTTAEALGSSPVATPNQPPPKEHDQPQSPLRLGEEEVAALHAKVAGLEALVAAMRHERDVTVDHIGDEGHENARRLQADLEATHVSDLDKILALISTLRESDRRMRVLEEQVHEASNHASELARYQRVAAEAEADLRAFSQKHATCVPEEDFAEVMTIIEQKLSDTEKALKKYRRAATVRGTQVDVLERRMAVMAATGRAAGAAPAAASPFGGSGEVPARPLTPRPDWEAIHKKVPDLAEFVASITSPETGDGDVFAKTVTGPWETMLQVDYLVDRLLTQPKPSPARAGNLMRYAEDGSASDPGQSLSLSKSSTAHAADADESGRIMSGSLAEAEIRRQMGLSVSKVVRGTATNYASAMVSLPILGRGCDSVAAPPHLRVAGVVPHLPLDPVDAKLLMFSFFQEVLRPHPHRLSPYLPISQLFIDFLRSRQATMEILQPYACAVHVSVNLVEDIKAGGALEGEPCAVLLVHLLEGTMPARVVLDALAVVNHVREEVSELAEEQSKTRLRRAVISETITPVLSLKTQREMEELRGALGCDTTYDVEALLCPESCFMSMLFNQECACGMMMYVSVLSEMSTRATFMEGHGMVITPHAIEEAIAVAEPQTPSTIIQEVVLAALAGTRVFTSRPDVSPHDSKRKPATGEGGKGKTSRRGQSSKGGGAKADGRPPREALDAPETSELHPAPLVDAAYLSEAVKALSAAPIIRRSIPGGACESPL